MRASGRTTRMLIGLAEYLNINYDKKKTVILLVNRIRYGVDLIRKLTNLLDIQRIGEHLFVCGKCSVIVATTIRPGPLPRSNILRSLF